MSGSKTKATDIIDLCSDDDAPARPRNRNRNGKRAFIPDDDVVTLESPPAHMRKWSNADKPINIDGEGDGEEESVEMYTPEERRRRRALMLENDPERPFVHPKKRTRSETTTNSSASTTPHTTPNTNVEAGPSTRPGRARDFVPPRHAGTNQAGPSRPSARTRSRTTIASMEEEAMAPPIPDVAAAYVRPARYHPIDAHARARLQPGAGLQPAAVAPLDAFDQEIARMRAELRQHVERAGIEVGDYPDMADVLAEPDVQAAILAPNILSDPVNPPVDQSAAELDNLLSRLLEILPDICPDYASQQLKPLNTATTRVGAVEAVASKALDDGYPKRKAEKAETRDDAGYLTKTYRAEKRIGEAYALKCVTALEEAFAVMPIGHIRDVIMQEANLFGPSYIHLLQDESAAVKPYVQLKRARPPSKGKGAAPPELDAGAIEFELEKNWVLAHVATERIANEARANKELIDELAIANGQGVECGCCFGEYVMDNMFQCRDGHLFCKECSTRHAETKLGDQSFSILCMDTSGCQAVFSEIELGRFLSNKSLELYHRLRLAQELEDAAIEGLETCPSCPWAIIIEDPEEKLIRCLNEACMMVSCRHCRKSEHLPLSCEEYAADRKKDKRHAVEDAMSEALIRKCPSCAKPYIKDTGCNKILCIKCRKYSCYICQKSIDGYDHFDQGSMHGGPAASSSKGKCRLWDPKEAEKDVDNVVAARDAAVQALRERAQAEGLEMDEADLAVEAPAPAVDPHAARYLAALGPHQAERAALLGINPLNIPPIRLPAMRDVLEMGRQQADRQQELHRRVEAMRAAHRQAGGPPVDRFGLAELDAQALVARLEAERAMIDDPQAARLRAAAQARIDAAAARARARQQGVGRAMQWAAVQGARAADGAWDHAPGAGGEVQEDPQAALGYFRPRRAER